MADPFGDQDMDQTGEGKRPAPTIEGTATEISVASPADEADEARSASREQPDEHEGAPQVSEVEAELADAPVEPPVTERRASPPPAASVSELKGFVTHLAAGLLGGLVGVIALAFAWHLLPAGKAGKASPNLTKIEARLAKLESAPAPSPDTEALAKFDDRIKALEGRTPETPPELSQLTDRVAQLESALKALAAAAKDGGSVTDAAAVNQQIAEAEQRLQAKLDAALSEAETANAAALQAMQSAIDELKAKVGALAEAGAGSGDSADVAALTERIAKLEASIDKEVAGTKSAAAAIAFANLRAAVAVGRPYAAELAAIRSFVPDPGDLGPLPAHADKGIPTVTELTRSFAANTDAALAAAAPAPSGSILDRLLASAGTLVKIKRVDEAATGDSPGAVLARAEALLDKGDLAGSVQQIDTLDGAPREAFAAWLDQARARLGADETVQRLEAKLLASVGGSAQKVQN